MPHTTKPLILNVDWLPYEAVERRLHYGLWVSSAVSRGTPNAWRRDSLALQSLGLGVDSPPTRLNRSNSPGPL